MVETQDNVEAQFAVVRQKYRALKLETKEDGSSLVRGELHFLASYNGKSIEDRYAIKIEISSEYPGIVPKVKETSGRIPQRFHRYEDETLCLGAPLQVKMKFRENPTLVGFIEDQVIPFLYSYSCFENTGKMPFGELPHGGEGIVKYYKDLLNLDAETTVLGFLRVLADDDYRGHHDCPCGGGKNLRACHGIQLREIMAYQTPDEFALEYLQIAKYFKESGISLPTLYMSKSLGKKLRKSKSAGKGD